MRLPEVLHIEEKYAGWLQLILYLITIGVLTFISYIAYAFYSFLENTKFAILGYIIIGLIFTAWFLFGFFVVIAKKTFRKEWHQIRRYKLKHA